MTETDLAVLETLKAILATLNRIEEQGKPKEVANFQICTTNGTSIDEDAVRQLARKELYWKIGGTGQAIRKQSQAEAEKRVSEAFIAQVESAPDGGPVQIGQCGACTVCDCED